MIDYEKLGIFYLGREHDPATRQTKNVPVLYDSRDLVTHALAVGMTGSGKTGLGITVIEEAAIDGVPVIVIDPKGDLTNLLLTFPDLRAQDFEPWVNTDDAARAGKTPAEFAAAEAERWKTGLSAWQQDGARIARLRASADFVVYTPGGSAAAPVSVLGSFAPPSGGDPELLRERVQTTASSLLALVGIDADPIKSREHILLSAVLTSAWHAGETLDLAMLVQRVQQPPMTRVGVIDVDSFFPPKDRFDFAMALNALLAAPGFELWTRGQPLDVAAFLRSPSGQPRVSIFSIAHLDDAYRMFFVSLLLNAVAGWMRTQSGTSSLRALLYMDEIFGFFPPISNPPAKLPLLTLLKQGRAAGLGVVLATQNPVDLDYKGLANIGTWWLGRLQTERDKARVLEGLESADAGAPFDRAEVDRLLSGLRTRVFLMRNVHDTALTLFETRWAMSYLRGPLGREDLKRLAPPPASDVDTLRSGVRPRNAPFGGLTPAPPPAAASVPATGVRPVLPPDVPQFFAPRPADPSAAGDPPLLRPIVYGAADVRFVDRKLKVDLVRPVLLAATVSAGAIPVDWDDAAAVTFAPDALETDAPSGASFEPVPAPATKARNYAAWHKQLAAYICTNDTIDLFVSPSTGEVSRLDETERDFRARLQHAAREARDEAVESLRRKYAPKIAAVDEKLRRGKQALDRETEQAAEQKRQTTISMGATIMSALFGRRSVGGTLGRATTAARGLGRSMKESKDIGRAQDTIATIEEQRAGLDAELTAETAAIHARTDPGLEAFHKIALKPKKAHVAVKIVALVWIPNA